MVVQSKFAIRRLRSYCMPFVVEHNIAGILGLITINFHDSFILCNSITSLQGEIECDLIDHYKRSGKHDKSSLDPLKETDNEFKRQIFKDHINLFWAVLQYYTSIHY